MNYPILTPVLAHITLVFALYLLLLQRKIAAAKKGGVDRREAALNCKAWPEDVVKVSNNLDNQFEAPVLSYGLCLFHHVTGGVNQLALILAWTFVFSRYVHTYVHTGTNYVPHRMKAFVVGMGSLFGLFVLAVLKVV